MESQHPTGRPGPTQPGPEMRSSPAPPRGMMAPGRRGSGPPSPDYPVSLEVDRAERYNRYAEALFDFSLVAQRWNVRATAYMFFMTERYPPFAYA